MQTLLLAVYRVVLALWVGGITVFTFVLTPAVFGNLARDEAGRVVGILFPRYFPYLLALSVGATVVFLLATRGEWRPPHWVSAVLLLAAVAVNAYVQFRLHPAAREVKVEIASFETVPADHPLRRRFARLHGISAVLNLVVLADGVLLLLLEPTLRR